MQDPDFDVTTVLAGRTAIVRVLGELDLATVQRLESAIEHALEGGSSRLVLDCRELRFMDSTGVALILRLHRASGRDGMTFVLAPGDGAVRRLLDLTGVGRHLALVDDPRELMGGDDGARTADGTPAPPPRPT